MTRALALVISLICVSVASLTATIKPAETRQPQYRVIESTEAGRMYVSKGILVFDIAEDEKTGFLGFDVLDLFWIKPEDFAFQARSFRHIGIGFTSGQEPQPSSVETLSLSVARNFGRLKSGVSCEKAGVMFMSKIVAGVRPVFFTRMTIVIGPTEAIAGSREMSCTSIYARSVTRRDRLARRYWKMEVAE